MKKTVVLLLIFHFSLIYSQGGIVNTIAGGGTSGLGDGGQATDAQLNGPYWIAIDKIGNLYISDWSDYRIRKVVSSGIISTIAGNGWDGYTGDGGQATVAEIGEPNGIAFDSADNLYIVDNFFNVIRKVDNSTGAISTVAGNGYQYGGGTGGWYSGDGGPATIAELNRPQAVCLDKSGNIYIADYYNNLIRKVTDSTGIITTVAGNGYGGWRGIGTWSGAYAGDGGQATEAELHGPAGVTVDDSNNVYIADEWNDAIRMVKASTGIITTVAGKGITGYSGNGGQATSAKLSFPSGVSFDNSGNMYIADGNNNVIRFIDKNSGIISTIAGNGYEAGTGLGGFSGDGGAATASEMYGPSFIAFDSLGNYYIADGGNNRIRKVTKDTDTVTGINELIAKSGEVRVFPNPSDGSFTVALSHAELVSASQTIIEVYNVLGEQVYNATLEQVQGDNLINLTGQPGGVYLYRVLDESGEIIGTGKFVIAP
jgi:trimeric autotransporter adhesin